MGNLVGLGCLVAAVLQQLTGPSAYEVRGSVLEAGGLNPVAAADVRIAPGGRSVLADHRGHFSFDLAGRAEVRIRVSRIGYVPKDTTLDVSSDTTVVILLDPSPIDLDPIAAGVLRPEGARSGRELFDGELQTGLVGISRDEIREAPAFGEVDVLRSLQALPGVIAVNELAATLHVMGGGPDQNVFLWDGARVFAPYHMFGLLGAFPPAAIDGVEFHRGAIPARFGGGLTSVVDISQGRADATLFADGTVGTVVAGLTAGGGLPIGTGTWMVGGRRTHADDFLQRLTGREFPYAFHDVHGRLSWMPTGDQRVQFSFLATGDRFAAGRDEVRQPGELDLRTEWTNGVLSGSWARAKPGGWSSLIAAAYSGYDGILEVGDYRADYTTKDVVSMATAAVRLHRRLTASARLGGGVEARIGRVHLVGGDGGGGYVEGSRRSSVRVLAGFAELEAKRGRFTVAPSLRVESDLQRGDLQIQPRISSRFQASNSLAFTASAGRTVQRLFTLQDSRVVLPGAPLWMAVDQAEPIAVADAVSLALDWWSGEQWNVELSGYARSFRGVPVWLPEGSRRLDGIRFDDGTAAGLEILVRRHAENVSGWLGYSLATVSHEDPNGRSYDPPWDRKHSLDAALFANLPFGLEMSGRLTLGTGTPFWPFAGHQVVPRLSTLHGQLMWQMDDLAPYFSGEQMRMPQHFRVDAALRWPLNFRGVTVEPFVGVLNANGRANVLYYRAEVSPVPSLGERPYLVPVTAAQATRIPTVGIRAVF